MEVSVGQRAVGLAVATRGDLDFRVEGADAALGDMPLGEAQQLVPNEAGVAVVDL